MTAQNNLEINGTIIGNPLAETAAEIAQAALTGSLRISDKDSKSVLYFRDGRLRFAVSNARSTRLFDALLRSGKLTRDEIVKIPNFSNDFELTEQLLKSEVITEDERRTLFSEQVRTIYINALSWTTGEWSFSPLAQVKESLQFDIDDQRTLAAYGRCLPPEVVSARFRSFDEAFTLSDDWATREYVSNEPKILVLLGVEPKTITQIIAEAGIEPVEVMSALYSLWMAGAIRRTGWRGAFADGVLEAMRDAKLIKTKSAVEVIDREEAAEKDADIPVAEAEAQPVITLDKYLLRVEKAQTYYQVLGIHPTASTDDVKVAYFSLARMFHPDHHHNEDGTIVKRVQDAFAELASAYETLRTKESRELYDYKVRKSLVNNGDGGGSGQPASPDDGSRRREQAQAEFDRGCSLLDNGDANAAEVPFARAAHLEPQNAKYRAFYGRALSANEKQRYKAEAEFQAAIKIDGNTPAYRLMLAEFFIDYNLLKRAEGELNRLLAVHPNNRDARELLASLKQ